MNSQLVESYFEWLLDFVCQEDYENANNIDICRELFETEFRWLIDRDENRAAWGVELRYRFCVENDIYAQNHDYLGLGSCSVLEMMVALAIKMDDILYDDNYGCRIYRWFWMFLENLGVKNGRKCPDLSHKLDIFMDREYTFEGYGNIIQLPNTKTDLRNVEIWYQICWFINDFRSEN